jgi:hypothetical protein
MDSVRILLSRNVHLYKLKTQWKLDICLTTTYFQFENKFYQQKEGMPIGNSLSPVASDIFMKHFEEVELDTVDHRPAK